MLAKCLKVIDFTVEDDVDRIVFVGHRLVAIDREIDDPKPPKTEAGGAISCDEMSRRIRTSMDQAVAHRGQHRSLDRPAVESQFTANAAHAITSNRFDYSSALDSLHSAFCILHSAFCILLQAAFFSSLLT